MRVVVKHRETPIKIKVPRRLKPRVLVKVKAAESASKSNDRADKHAIAPVNVTRSSLQNVNLTQSQADKNLTRVMKFYDLGAYVDGMEAQGLSAQERIEILASIAKNSEKESQRRGAIRDLDRILDRNVEASGNRQHGHATKQLDDGTRITVSLSAIAEVSKVARLFDDGLGQDSLPLYREDLSNKEPTQQEKNKLVANPSGETQGAHDATKDQDSPEVESPTKSPCEGSSQQRPSGQDGECAEPNADGNPGGDQGSEGVQSDHGSDKSAFCQPLSELVEGSRQRHLGHFPPSTFVPGGGITGVPDGANPYTYGEERCITTEESRRLAKRAVNEGMDSREVADASESSSDYEYETEIANAKREAASVRQGKPIVTRKLGPITVLDVVQGQPEED